MNGLQDVFVLANGVTVPAVGFGTWQVTDAAQLKEGMTTALEAGYRHIDTAAVYGNEWMIGELLAGCGIPRDELFITSKLWNRERGYDWALRAFEKTLRELRTDYLDLYLIHWPDVKDPAKNLASWRAFEKLYGEGRIKAIGLSNFLPHHLTPLMDAAEIMPMVDQIECHPGMPQRETVDFCRVNNILVEAWSPLGSGRLLKDPELNAIAARYGKSPAQLCIRWCLQHRVLPLPKSVTPSRIDENRQVFDFSISAEDMLRLDSMANTGWSGLNPDKVDF